jgi:MFS family permease
MKTKNQAFIILSICGMFLFLKYIAQLFPSLISTALIEQYQMNGVQIGILASSYYYSYTIMQIVSGVVLDKYSLKIASFLAILTIAAGLYIFPHTHSFVSMCFSRVMMGVGCSFATTLYMKAATIWTSDKAFCFISSLLATATMVGAAVGSAPIALLFDKVDWHQGLLYISYVGFGLAFLALLFVKQKDKPSQASTLSLNDVKKIISNRNNLYLLLYSGLTFSPVVILGGLWGVPFLEIKCSISATGAAQLISLMFLGHAVGSPVWALLSYALDNKKHLMLFANIISFTSLCMLLYVPLSFAYTEVLFVLFGFCVGVFMLSFDLCRQINSAALMGFAVAFINSGEGVVSSLFEPGIGLVLDGLKTAGTPHFTQEHYQIALSILPACFIMSTALIYKLPFTDKMLAKPYFLKQAIYSSPR